VNRLACGFTAALFLTWPFALAGDSRAQVVFCGAALGVVGLGLIVIVQAVRW
jgi:hypothetical protein